MCIYGDGKYVCKCVCVCVCLMTGEWVLVCVVVGEMECVLNGGVDLEVSWLMWSLGAAEEFLVVGSVETLGCVYE